MSHDITPNSIHSVVTLRFAVKSESPCDVIDGITSLLSPEIGEGWLADYECLHSEAPFQVQSPQTPTEGCLFDKAQLFSVCVQDSDYNEEWFLIESTQNLASLNEDELYPILSEHIVLGSDDRVFIGHHRSMQRISIP